MCLLPNCNDDQKNGSHIREGWSKWYRDKELNLCLKADLSNLRKDRDQSETFPLFADKKNGIQFKLAQKTLRI